MLTLPSSVRIYLFTAPADMRKGFDGLAGLVRLAGLDLFSGHLFVFVSAGCNRTVSVQQTPHCREAGPGRESSR